MSKNTTLRPAADQVMLVQLDADNVEKRTKGGIIIPGTAEEERGKLIRCKVVDMGPGHLVVTEAGEKVRVTVEDIVGRPIKRGSLVSVSKFTQSHDEGGKTYRLVKADALTLVEA